MRPRWEWTVRVHLDGQDVDLDCGEDNYLALTRFEYWMANRPSADPRLLRRPVAVGDWEDFFPSRGEAG